MSAKTFKTKKASQVAFYIVILLLLVGCVGFFAYFTNGFTSDFTTFYVEVDGKQILVNTSGYEMDELNPLTVDVGYTFEDVNEDIKGYTVKVVPNKIDGKDFTFTVDGKTKTYSEVADLTTGFNIIKEESSFTISPLGSINGILQSVYSGSEVSDCSTNAYENMFKLIVTSYNGASSIEIDFSVNIVPVGVILDQEVILF